MKTTKTILVVVGLVFAGCGISTTNETAFDISPEELGLELAGATTTQPQNSSNDAELIGRLYLVNETGSLVPVNRRFRSQPDVQDILDALSLQPLASEIAENGNLATQLPPTLAPRVVESNGSSGVVIVGVDDAAGLRATAVSDTGRTNRIFAQIVCSLDWFQIQTDVGSREMTGVTVVDSQGPIFATDSETAPIDRPASPDDFGNCT